MLFVYDTPRQMTFWMKNTLIPLDILFLDPRGTILDIQTMQPCPQTTPSCPTFPATAPAQYALEVNEGKALEWGLKVGDRMSLRVDSSKL